MLLNVDFSVSTFRWLFEPIYESVLHLALMNGYTESTVRGRMATLVQGIPDTYLLIDLQDTEVKGHCLCNRLAQRDTVFIEQLDGGETFIREALDYLEQHEGVHAITLIPADSQEIADFHTKFEFQFQRGYLIREVKRDGTV